jgi:thiol-disulfide isomerase/thioredoxin
MSKLSRIAGFSIILILVLSTGYFIGFASYAPIQRVRSRLSTAQKKETEESRLTEKYMNKVAPEIISETLGGQKWLLTNQRGKVVLVLIWSILCNDCVKEIPEMNRIQSTYGKRKDFLLIGVHRFPEKDIISCYCSAKGILWPQLYENGESFQTGFIDTMGIKRTPSICIIDKEGKVRGINMDLGGAEQEVRGLLE